jgi:hypothetical protein
MVSSFPTLPLGNENRAASISAFEGVLGKLEAVLVEENLILEARATADHAPFIVRKNQILREFMILQKSDPQGDVISGVVDRLRFVRRLIDTNRHHLRLQVQAMSEMTEMLTEVALAEDADGTYSRSQ